MKHYLFAAASTLIVFGGGAGLALATITSPEPKMVPAKEYVLPLLQSSSANGGGFQVVRVPGVGTCVFAQVGVWCKP